MLLLNKILMKFLLLLITLSLSATGIAQQNTVIKKIPVRITESSIVKDSSGTAYSMQTWKALLATGRYSLKADNNADDNFFLVRISDEEFEKKVKNLPKPKESVAFKPGSNFQHIKGRDINNEKINTKKLAGKVLVLNFWFINCPPCVQEMPELNKIVEEYKNDSNVVFIAIALDDDYDVKQFLKKRPFKYNIIGGGKHIAGNYGVRSYPTHVVVSTDGKIHFSSTGYSGLATTTWLKKSIEESKNDSAEISASE